MSISRIQFISLLIATNGWFYFVSLLVGTSQIVKCEMSLLVFDWLFITFDRIFNLFILVLSTGQIVVGLCVFFIRLHYFLQACYGFWILIVLQVGQAKIIECFDILRVEDSWSFEAANSLADIFIFELIFSLFIEHIGVFYRKNRTHSLFKFCLRLKHLCFNTNRVNV